MHRLNNLGAVVTHVTRGRSQEGFDAEWREVFLLTVGGDLLSRCELFDEADIDAALARFEQLTRPAPRLENAASEAYERVQACFAARDWDAMANAMAQNMVDDDRRRMVNAGIRRGRDIEIANSHAVVEIGGERLRRPSSDSWRASSALPFGYPRARRAIGSIPYRISQRR